MFNKFCVIIFILFLNNFLIAQEIVLPTNYDNGTNLNIIYKNDISGQFYLHSRGIGLTFHQGRHITTNSRSFYELDVRSMSHPKQVKLTGEAQDRRRFVYGKLNSVMIIGGSLGMQKTIFAKADNKSVEIRFAYSLGSIFALAKPYYIQVEKQSKYITFNNESFTPSKDRITGRAPFSKGLDELKIYPGINAKFNISFEYAPYTNLIRAVETGLSLDYFPKALPMMARNPSENFLLTLRVGFVFGMKWY
jgi:hypothetical protein